MILLKVDDRDPFTHKRTLSIYYQNGMNQTKLFSICVSRTSCTVLPRFLAVPQYYHFVFEELDMG